MLAGSPGLPRNAPMMAQRACVLPLENGILPAQSPAAGGAFGGRARRQR